MLLRPMIGAWEVPNIAAVYAEETRRLAALPVPGLSGDLHQDLGRGALRVHLSGSLSGDQTRDDFLKEIRARFLAGDPVDFVADIVTESELEQVLIESLEFAESATEPETFRYHIVLREYTEPPEPPGLDTGFGADVDLGLDLDVGLGLDLLDLPGLMIPVPKVGDLLSPLKPAAEELKNTLAKAGDLLGPLDRLLKGTP
jgi:hypothetical protein